MVLTGNPEPEGGAAVFTSADDADVASTTFSNRFTNGQSHTGALHELIELDETVEHHLLFVLRDADAGILAVEVHAVLLIAVAQSDVALFGELYGVGDEVGEHLLDTFKVERGNEGVVGILLDELQFLAMHALLEGQADVVEGGSEVDGLGLDCECAAADGRGLVLSLEKIWSCCPNTTS